MDADETAVSIPYPPEQKKPPMERASFWQRFWAYAIDMIILSALDGCFSLIIGSSGLLSSIIIGQGWLPVMMGIILSAIPALYFIIPYSSSGQTLGKTVLKIKVISIDGAQLNLAKGLLRTLGYIPSSLLFDLGFLSSMSDINRQAWHDKMAGTVVVPAFITQEQFQGTIDSAELLRKQRSWVLRMVIPTILVILIGSFTIYFFTNRGIAEVRQMGPWPAPSISPAVVAAADLSHLGLSQEQVQDARDQDSWAGGSYEEGILVTYKADSESVAGIWALRYKDKQSAKNDFEMVQVNIQSNCGRYSYAYLGYSAVIHCEYGNAYQKLFLNDYWIINIVAMAGTQYTPDVLVDGVRDAIAAHWATLGNP